MLNFCDFIQVYVFTTNHHLKIPCEITPPCSGKHCVIPLGTLQGHSPLSANFVTVEVLLVMVRLTEVQRGQATALLIQGQRQQ